MKTKIKILIFTTLISSLSVLAKVDKQDISLFEVSRVHKNIKQVVSKFEVIKSTDDSFEIYVPTFKTGELLELIPESRLISKNIYDEENTKLLGEYRTYVEVVTLMYELEKKYPKLISVNSYGKSVKGYDLLYMKISDNVDIDENEPELLITAATHGDELITTESRMRFLVNMMKGKDSNFRINRMIQEHELFFIPIVNPDGFVRKRRYTANGIDPNREYPYPKNPDKKSVQCIKKEIDFFHSRNFVGSMDLHAHGEMIMYPWGYTRDEVVGADKSMFERLGKEMAKENKYRVGQISRIIYVAPASSADYYYWKNGTIAFGIEIAKSKVPRSRKIDKIVNDVTNMIYTFIENF